MKSYLLFVLLLGLGLSSCSERSEWKRSDVRNNLLQEGLWSITYLVEDGRDETARFAEVLLRFESNNRVVALVDGQEIEGRWNLYREREDNQRSFELEMDFPEENSLLYHLDEDWYLMSMSADEMQFGEDYEDGETGFCATNLDEEYSYNEAEYLTLSRLNEFN